MSRWPIRIASRARAAWSNLALDQAVNFAAWAGMAWRAGPAAIATNRRVRLVALPGMSQSDADVRVSNPLAPPLIGAEGRLNGPVGGVTRQPCVAAIDGHARIERHAKGGDQPLHPVARDQIQERAADDGVDRLQRQATRH